MLPVGGVGHSMRQFTTAFVVFIALYSGIIASNIWPQLGSSLRYTVIYTFLVLASLLILGLVACIGIGGWLITSKHGFLKAIRFAAAGLLAFVICLVVDQVWSGGLPIGSNQLTFNSAAWLAPGANNPAPTPRDLSIRQQMLLDVVRNVLPGRTQQEIEQLLGPGTPNGFLDGMGHDLIYHTGRQRDSLFAIDSEWLLIWLDDNGRFQRFELASD
jgi:hypothetical protein